MKHAMVTFRLHRTAVIFIIVGALLAGLLLFAGGYLFAMRRLAVKAVVAPAVAAPPVAVVAAAPAPAPAQKGAVFAVRVAMFDTEEEAKALVQTLTAQKLEATIVPLTTAAGIKLYTVEVGSYPTRAEAAANATTLADDQGLRTAVVPAGK